MEACSQQQKKMVVVLNPTAGRGAGAANLARLKDLLAHASAEARFPVEIVETTKSGDATRLARASAESGALIVAAAGGDGTISEVINGLVGTRATLDILPLGTGNDFARHLGLGTDLDLAVQTLFYGTPQSLDLGFAQGRWFHNVAGCGLDAVVAARANRGYRFLRGTSAYIAAVLQSLFTYRSVQMRLTVDGETVTRRAMLCSVANATTYGGGMLIAPDAKTDDGLFDICLIADVGTIEFLRAFPRVFKGTHTTHPKVTMLRGRHVRIETDTPLPVLIDGDVFGTTPVEFALHPAVVKVLFPRCPN
jgi:diacylglycerol kinase (ATP)